MTKDGKHLFMCLIAISMCSLVSAWQRLWLIFLIGLFVFLLFSFKSSLYILDSSPLSLFKSSLLVCEYLCSNSVLQSKQFWIHRTPCLSALMGPLCHWCWSWEPSQGPCGCSSGVLYLCLFPSCAQFTLCLDLSSVASECSVIPVPLNESATT